MIRQLAFANIELVNLAFPLRVAQVIGDYTFNERAQAPEDSRAVHGLITIHLGSSTLEIGSGHRVLMFAIVRPPMLNQKQLFNSN